MGKRISQKRERGLLDDLNKKRKLFSRIPCIKELVQKEKQGDKEVEKVVLKKGAEYTIFDSGLHLGDGKTYYGITTSTLNEPVSGSLSIETHPATLFFEANEIEEYFNLGKIIAAGYTIQDAVPLTGITYDVNKLVDIKE